MKIKEKEELLSYLGFKTNDHLHPNEVVRKNELLLKIPNNLFKYRPFDTHTEEMFNENYAYLSPIKDLDDPFDCLIHLNENCIETLNEEYIIKKITDRFIKFNHDRYKKFLSLKEYRKIVNFVLSNLDNTDYCVITLKEKYDSIFTICNEIVAYIFIIFYEVRSHVKTVIETYNMFEKNLKNSNIGILSLSETNKNKLLWSLYSNKYSGYCVEYEIPKTKEILNSTYPVVYSKKESANLLDSSIDYFLGHYRRFHENQPFYKAPFLKTNSFNKLFCNKYSDWSFQKEWRIFGEAEEHYNKLKIVSVYLGFKVSDNDKALILKYANSMKFNVFIMEKPNKNKTLKFRKIY